MTVSFRPCSRTWRLCPFPLNRSWQIPAYLFSIATRIRTGWPGNRSWESRRNLRFSPFHLVDTGSAPPPPVSYSMGIIGGCSTARKLTRGWNLPIHLNLVTKLRIFEALPPFPHMSSLCAVQGQFYSTFPILRVLCWSVWIQEVEATRISRHSAREDGKVVSPTHRLPVPPTEDTPGTHFC